MTVQTTIQTTTKAVLSPDRKEYFRAYAAYRSGNKAAVKDYYESHKRKRSPNGEAVTFKTHTTKIPDEVFYDWKEYKAELKLLGVKSKTQVVIESMKERIEEAKRIRENNYQK